MLRYSIAAIIAVGGAFATSPAQAAKGWHAVQTQSGGPSSRKVNMYYADHKLRLEPEGDPNIVIIDLPTGDVMMVDTVKKLYTQASLRDLMAMRDKMKAAMKKRLESMPPEVKKNIEKMMKEQEEAQNKPLELKKTGKSDTVSGHKCKYFSWTSAEGTGQACIADKLPVDTKGFRNDALKLIAAMKKAGAGSAGATNLPEFQLAKHGFPVKTIRELKMGPNQIKVVSIVDSIKAVDVPASKMSAPKGFKKTSFQDFNQLQAGPATR